MFRNEAITAMTSCTWKSYGPTGAERLRAIGEFPPVSPRSVSNSRSSSLVPLALRDSADETPRRETSCRIRIGLTPCKQLQNSPRRSNACTMSVEGAPRPRQPNAAPMQRREAPQPLLARLPHDIIVMRTNTERRRIGQWVSLWTRRPFRCHILPICTTGLSDPHRGNEGNNVARA